MPCHSLNIDESVEPVKQKKKKGFYNSKMYNVTDEKVERLLKVGFIKEVQYSNWLSNVVIVKKKNGKWRFYVDITNLNKARPKGFTSRPKYHIVG